MNKEKWSSAVRSETTILLSKLRKKYDIGELTKETYIYKKYRAIITFLRLNMVFSRYC